MGACRDAPSDIFYPDRDASTYQSIASSAKVYCHGTSPGTSCPVLLECLFYALVTNDRFGIWGGMSPRERSALRRIGSLSKYHYAQQHMDNPYRELIDNYLEQHGRDEEESDEGAEGEGGESAPEDVPRRREA